MKYEVAYTIEGYIEVEADSKDEVAKKIKDGLRKGTPVLDSDLINGLAGYDASDCHNSSIDGESIKILSIYKSED